MSRRAAYVTLLVAAVALRLYFLVFTIGTSDVAYKRAWASLALKHGVGEAYAKSPYLNEPPLIIAASALMLRAEDVVPIEFSDLYRAVQIVADGVACVALIVIARRAQWSDPREPALLYFVSPAVIFLSAFHCNADATLVALILVSFALLPASATAAGIALGAATGVKVVALLLLPIVLCVVSRRAAFASGFVAAIAVIFGVPALDGGLAVITNTFGYHGVGNWWGVPSMARALSMAVESDLPLRLVAGYDSIVRLVVAAIVGIGMLLAWRTRRRAGHDETALMTASAFVFVAVLVVASGFGVQYLSWPLAFLPFALGRGHAIVVHAAVSLFLFTVYTQWSGGFPWSYADADAAGAVTTALVTMGWVVWLLLAASAIVIAKRNHAPT